MDADAEVNQRVDELLLQLHHKLIRTLEVISMPLVVRLVQLNVLVKLLDPLQVHHAVELYDISLVLGTVSHLNENELAEELQHGRFRSQLLWAVLSRIMRVLFAHDDE